MQLVHFTTRVINSATFRFGLVIIVFLGSLRIQFHHKSDSFSRMLCFQRKDALEMRGYQNIFRLRIAAMLKPN